MTGKVEILSYFPFNSVEIREIVLAVLLHTVKMYLCLQCLQLGLVKGWMDQYEAGENRCYF